MNTFANSLTWNFCPAMVIQRWPPRMLWPMTSTSTSNPRVTRYNNGANVPNQA